MIKIKNIILQEMARRNPDQNPKYHTFDQLAKYANDPDVYISFTDIQKLGVNPNSTFITPLGIYTYPLKEIYTTKEEFENLPLGVDRPYTWVVKPKQGKNVVDILEYNNLDEDIETLRRLYEDKFPAQVIELHERKKIYMESFDDALNYVRNSAMLSYDGHIFFKFVRTLASINFTDIKKIGGVFASILRHLGYDGITDKGGTSTIHENEPTQAVFLSIDDINIIEMLYNRVDSVKGGKTPVYYQKMLTLVEQGRKIPREDQDIVGDDDMLGEVLIKWSDKLFNYNDKILQNFGVFFKINNIKPIQYIEDLMYSILADDDERRSNGEDEQYIQLRHQKFRQALEHINKKLAEAVFEELSG